MGGGKPPHFARIDAYVYYYNQKMYVRGPQHSITGGGNPPQYIQVGGGGEIPPHFARIDTYDYIYAVLNFINQVNTSVICLRMLRPKSKLAILVSMLVCILTQNTKNIKTIHLTKTKVKLCLSNFGNNFE